MWESENSHLSSIHAANKWAHLYEEIRTGPNSSVKSLEAPRDKHSTWDPGWLKLLSTVQGSNQESDSFNFYFTSCQSSLPIVEAKWVWDRGSIPVPSLCEWETISEISDMKAPIPLFSRLNAGTLWLCRISLFSTVNKRTCLVAFCGSCPVLCSEHQEPGKNFLGTHHLVKFPFQSTKNRKHIGVTGSNQWYK